MQLENLKSIDIGINLMNKQFDKDRETIVKRALEQGIGLIITGTDIKSSRNAIEFIRSMQGKGYKSLWSTVGCHPHNAREFDSDYHSQMLKLIHDNRDIVVAVGECGLDYDRMFSSIQQQKKAFECIQNTAEAVKLPMFLHERDAEDEFVKIMKVHRSLCRNSIVHCFTGSKQTAYRYIQMGFYIGLTGWICDNRRNKQVLEAIKIIPLERILVETDAPYLTPLSIGNKQLKLDRRNEPSNLHYVYEKIAEIKKVDVEIVREKALENTIRLFSL